jgi:hypothetical protein
MRDEAVTLGMGAPLETGMTESRRDLRASALRGLFVLRRRDARLYLAPDGSTAWLDSLSERRLLFGRESVEIYKIQAGVKIPGQKPDWRVSFLPSSVAFAGRYFESLDVSQSVELVGQRTIGTLRRIRIRNSGSNQIRVRLVTLHDPTTAHFPSDTGRWGSVSVNAFNRTSHVAMDEVADPPCARVIGARPAPKSIFMTTDRGKVEEILREGDVPDSTAGMSGQILVLVAHELDLSPQEAKEIDTLSIYDSSKLEIALAEFDRYPVPGGSAGTPRQNVVSSPSVPPSSSSSALGRALLFARSALEGAEFEQSRLDRVECIEGLAFADPSAARRIIEGVKAEAFPKRYLAHSGQEKIVGRLETAVFLAGASRFSILTGDKKYMRSIYPFLRRLAEFLSEVEAKEEKEGRLASSVPQGWRRELGKGFPTGLTSELLLTSAGALGAAASLASALGKGEDSARYTERSELLIDLVRKRLLDERGSLLLSVESNGTVHKDDTIDQAVGLSRCPFDRAVASTTIQRLQEKDFQTGFGPRTVPTSNKVFFNSNYGSGQLGGYWTRAALAHGLLSYEAGYSGLASLELQKVASLVSDKVALFGVPPGTFPLWMDIESSAAHGRGSDPVAAARFLEVVVRGELGLSSDSRGCVLRPPGSSNLRWIMLSDIWLGEAGVSVFVGRGKGRVFTFARCSKVEVEEGARFTSFEALQPGSQDLAACVFYGPGQVVCVGNTATRSNRASVSFVPRDPELLKHLSAGLEELDSTSGSWRKLQTLRVAPVMSVDVSLGPEDWKAIRLSTA